MEILNRNQFVMCRGKKCCPVVTVDGDNVTIVDDYKNSVKMTKEQFMEIETLQEHLRNTVEK